MMLVAWFMFSLIDTSVKWLVLAGFPVWQLAFMRYAGHAALSLADMGRSGAWRLAIPKNVRLIFLIRAALLVSATFFNFYSLKFLPLTVTASIMFSAPIFVCALSMPLLGERVGLWRWGAILVGFVGVLIVIRPWSAAFHWVALLTVYNALALALFSIFTRRLSGIVSTATMQASMGVLGTVALAPMAAFTWMSPSTPLDWALLIGLGLWGWLGHELMTRAHRFATASVLMPFTYTFLLWLTLSSWLVFGEVPDAATVLGASIIVGSGLLIWWRERGQ